MRAEMRPPLQIVSLDQHRDAAGTLFDELHCDPEADRFHPHAMIREHAYRMTWAHDIYVLVLDEHEEAIAYGMLRGWDQGFTTPSLGIAVRRDVRGSGIARLLMDYLHMCARLRDAPAIRLRVYPDNAAAIALYHSLGYVFGEALEDGQLVGIRPVPPRAELRPGEDHETSAL